MKAYPYQGFISHFTGHTAGLLVPACLDNSHNLIRFRPVGCTPLQHFRNTFTAHSEICCSALEGPTTPWFIWE